MTDLVFSRPDQKIPGGKQTKGKFSRILRSALLLSIFLSLALINSGFAQGLFRYMWVGSMPLQFTTLPHEGFEDHAGEVLAFTFWQGGDSFIGEDPTEYAHMQGIARYDVNGVPYFFISRNGNEIWAGTDYPGELYVARMGSESGSNGEALGEVCDDISGGHCEPWLENKTVHNFLFANELMAPDENNVYIGWKHAGGMQIYEHYLLVALEKTCDAVFDEDYPDSAEHQYYCGTVPGLPNDEEVRGAMAIFDLSNLASCPAENCLPMVDIITEYTDSSGTHDLPTMGAVGLTEVETTSGTEYLMTHASGDMTDWMFLSSTDLFGPYSYETNVTTTISASQTANLVYSKPDNILYMVTTSNSTSSWGGTDYFNLFRVGTDPISLNFVQQLHVYTENEDGLDIGDLTAVGGVYASPSGRLIIYTGPYDNDYWNFASHDDCDNPYHTELCKSVQFGEMPSLYWGTAPILTLTDQTAVTDVSTTFTLGSFYDEICPAGFTTTINWGDATPNTTLTIPWEPDLHMNISADHTYGSAGVFDGFVEVMDCDGLVGRDTFQTEVIDINDPPAGTDGSYMLSENSSHTFQASNFGFQDPLDSPPNNLLSVHITTLPTAGSLALSGTAVTAGQDITMANIQNLVFTPAADANGSPYASFTFQVRDDGGTASGGVDLDPTPNTLTFSVIAVNGEPSFTSGGNVAVLEDSGAYSAAWASAIDDGDPELSQTLSFVIASNSNTSLFSAGPSIASDGTLSFTPAADANGSATIGVELHDNGGTVNGGDDTYGPISFTITVTSVNDEPSFTSGGDVGVNENPGAYAAAWASTIDDGDPELTQTLTFVVTGNSNPGLFSAGPSVAANGTLSFTPAADTSGSAQISLELRDNGGTANGGDNTYGPITFTISVAYINTEPSFTGGGNITVAEDSGTWSGTWATNISDGDPEVSQSTWFTTGITSGAGLLTSIPALATNGLLIFTPAADAAGTVGVQVYLYDDGGTANGGDDTFGPVNFNIIITPVNDPPTDITLDNSSIAENEPAGSHVGNLNTTDPDTGDSHTYSLVTGVSGCDSSGNASFQISGAELQSAEVFEYESGPTSYTVCIQTEDSENETYTRQFTITVENVNEAPVNSVPAPQSTNDSTPLTFSTADGNLIFVSDEDAGSLDVNITLSAANGTLTLGGTAGLVFSSGDGFADPAMTFSGSLTALNAALDGLVYDPDPSFTGVDILTITSDDLGNTGSGGAQTDTDTISITVSALPPTILTNDVDSIPTTADGMLTPGETLRSLTQILVRFSELMDETTPGDEVTNPLNYLLIFAGSDGAFQTGTCDDVKNGPGVDPADLAIPISSVVYDDITSVATLTLGSGLNNGWYRLYVCGSATLRDLAGTALAGDGATEGTDYTLDFRIYRTTGGGENGDDTALGLLIPVTGFAPGQVTVLPEMPAGSRYTDAGMTLVIPSLGVNLPIVGVPLAGESWDVTWLGRSAGWLEGSAFPTWPGNTVLTGHVWDASNLPGPFAGLKNLRYGDRFEIHAYGQTFTYEVRANALLHPWQVGSAFRHEELDWVTLLTCEDFNPVSADYTYRRAVRAVLVNVE